MKDGRPVVALMYDFDKTLSVRDMQEYSFIPSLGMKSEDFWREADGLATRESMDSILAYMYLMIRRSRAAGIPVRRENFVALGREIEFFPGVEEWFSRVNSLCDGLGMTAEHYLISSGLGEIVEGCSIADRFTKIYACGFHYDENGAADWPRLAINYTLKTQFIFRINKGVLEVSDDEALNRSVPESEKRVPFSNMIYVGDGLTDVPSMKLVRANGGSSIAVYRERSRAVADRLLEKERVDFIAPADYREGGRLDRVVTALINRIASNQVLIGIAED